MNPSQFGLFIAAAVATASALAMYHQGRIGLAVLTGILVGMAAAVVWAQ